MATQETTTSTGPATWAFTYCETCGQRVWTDGYQAGRHIWTDPHSEDRCADRGYTPGALALSLIRKHGVSLPEVLMHIDDALAALGAPELTEQQTNQLMVALRDGAALPAMCVLRTSAHWAPEGPSRLPWLTYQPVEGR